MNKEIAIIMFKEKSIRRTWHHEEWWFAIVDVVAAVTDSSQPAGYLKDMRRRDPELNKGWGQIATPLSIETSKVATRGGKVAGNARKETEKELGKSIISQDNYLNLLETD